MAYSKLATRSDGIFTRAYSSRDDVKPDTTVYIPTGVDWRSMNFERERTGAYLAAQWKPSENFETYVTAFRSKYNILWDESAAFPNTDPSNIDVSEDATYDSAGAFISGRLSRTGGLSYSTDIRAADKDTITTDYSIGFKWMPGDNWEISSDIQSMSASSKGLDSTVALGVTLDYIDVDLSGQYPKILTDSEYLADPQHYYWGFTSPDINNDKQDQISWKTDLTYFVDNSFVKSIKSGVRLTEKKISNEQTNLQDFAPIYQEWMVGWKLDSIPTLSGDDIALVAQKGFSGFFNNKTQVPSNIYAPIKDVALNFPDAINQLHAAAVQYYAEGTDTYKPLSIGPEDINSQDEKTLSFYLMSDFEFADLSMPIDGNIGLRLVKTDLTSDGYLIYPEQAILSSPNEELNYNHTYTNLLPSFNVRMKVRDDVFLRFATAKTLARPDVNQLQGNVILQASAIDSNVQSSPSDFVLTGIARNPDLNPTTGNQFNLSAEWYFDDAGGMAHVTYFAQNIKDFVRQVDVETEYQNNTYMVSTAKNIGTADINGFELGWSQFFDGLPAPFDGLGFQANYTHLDSSTNVPNEFEARDINGKSFSDLPYEGLSKDVYNITGIYETSAWSFRLAYNWRSEYLMSVSPNGWRGWSSGTNKAWGLPIFADDYGQLDGSIAYKLTNNVTLSLEANNIANSETRIIMKQTDAGEHIASHFVNDVRYALTLRGSF